MRRSVRDPLPVRSESSARRCSPATSAAQSPREVLRWTDPLTAWTMASSTAVDVARDSAPRSGGARYTAWAKTQPAAASTAQSTAADSSASRLVLRRAMLAGPRDAHRELGSRPGKPLRVAGRHQLDVAADALH